MALTLFCDSSLLSSVFKSRWPPVWDSVAHEIILCSVQSTGFGVGWEGSSKRRLLQVA